MGTGQTLQGDGVSWCGREHRAGPSRTQPELVVELLGIPGLGWAPTSL